MNTMTYYVSKRGFRLIMGLTLLILAVWFIISGLTFESILYFVFTITTLVLAINVTLDGTGTNKLIVNKNEVVLYRLPFFIKRVPISKIEKIDYVEVDSLLRSKDVVRMYYDSNRHIRISDYSVDSSLIKLKIEETISKM
jgi:hypothetical protein